MNDFYWLQSQTVYYFYITNRMGNTSKSPEEYQIVRNYRQQDWQATQKGEIGEIWRHRKTHELAQIYRLYNIPSIEDMNRYQLRASQQNLVSVYHIALIPNQGMCFKQHFVRLLIQYIPIRLEQVNGIQLQQALTILLALFKGFNTLTTLFGPIQPHQNMVGFNQWGKAKVWLNKSFNNNFPQTQISPNLDKSRVQPSHVRKIFDFIQRKTATGQLPNSLKELFRIDNPNYLQAILIIEQFAYRNELSLQRYIRTDILIRRSSVHQPSQLNRQLSHSRKISNQNINCKTLERPQLKRIHSVDALHTQRLANHSQSSVTVPFVQLKESLNFSSGPQKKRFYGPGIPKITFQKSGFAPFNNHSSMIVNNEIQRTSFILNHSQQFSRHSILSNPQQSLCIPSPVKEVANKKLNIVHQVSENLFFESPKKEKPQIQQVMQVTINNTVRQGKEQYRIQIPESTSNVAIEIPQAETMRSIIDKVDSEILSNQQSNKYYQQQQYPQHHLQAYEQYREEEIQVSGTFNYKAQNREQAHLQHSLEQIGEEQDYSKEKQNDSDIRIKEEVRIDELVSQIRNKQESQVQQDQVLKSKSQNMPIPIGYQSFAQNKIQIHQFVSFAPDLQALETQKSIKSYENVQNVQTSKSFQCEQQNHQRQNSVQSIQQMQETSKNQQQRFPQQKQQIYNLQQQSKKQQKEGSDEQRSLMKKRASIDLYYQKNSQSPFYAHYTPVQSKFDVVVKRDSILSREDQGRPSAFEALQTDEQIENYIRNKYESYMSDKNTHNTYHKQEVKVGRVQSQYQKHYVKESESYDAKKYQKADSNKFSKGQVKYNKISNIVQKPEEDYLDVNFLEKSLDKRYSSHFVKKQEEDELNIAKLDEGLMKFSNSKVSLNSKDSKKVQQSQIKPEYNQTSYDYVSKWDHSTGFEYTSKYKPQQNKYSYNEPIKYIEQYSSKYQEYSSKPQYKYDLQQAKQQSKKKSKKSVRIQNTPTHQFVYQLSSSDYGQFANIYKSPPKSPTYSKKDYSSSSKKEQGKKSLEERYNKYVKNTNKGKHIPKTPSITNLMSVKGDSRLMLSPIPQKRWQDDGRLSYDHLRSFLLG